MLSSIKALFLTTLMVAASVSAAPSADVNGISRREDAPLVTLLGSELNVLNTAQPEAAQATCRGANAFKEGSGCVGRGGQFACSLNCFDIVRSGPSPPSASSTPCLVSSVFVSFSYCHLLSNFLFPRDDYPHNQLHPRKLQAHLPCTQANPVTQIVCGRGVWQLSAKCNQPSCRATQVNGTPGCA